MNITKNITMLYHYGYQSDQFWVWNYYSLLNNEKFQYKTAFENVQFFSISPTALLCKSSYLSF